MMDDKPIPGMPKESTIIRIMNMSLTIQAIYFIKTRNVISTAGYIKDADRYLCAILHKETQKIVAYTKPAFKTKKQALTFGDELIYSARQTKIS